MPRHLTGTALLMRLTLMLLAAAQGADGRMPDASLGVLLPLRWGGADQPIQPSFARYAASAAMAVYHVNQRSALLVPKAKELLPENFTMVFDMHDTLALPSVAVKHVVQWNQEGRHAVIGSYRSAVTGPLALAASIAATPVVVWGATASS
eukprot:3937372-Rhodomonas_salina.1